MHETAIDVQNLSRNFNYKKGNLNKKKVTTNALSELSFQVKKGEVFGLLGPNGAGKTTTIKILTTLLTPTDGDVKVLGIDPVKHENKLRPKINFVYGGERNLYWRITARENLSYFADLYKVSKDEKKERISYLLDLVRLTSRADDRVETFSKGMKQRLQIARGLINDPDILFLDEPTIGLDPIGARELREIVKSLTNLGKTVLLTTHYMEEADELCDRIAFIKNGKIIAVNTPGNFKKVISRNHLIEINLNNQPDHKSMEILRKNQLVKELIITNDGDICNVKVRSKSPYQILNSIIDLLNNFKIIDLQTRQPSLEDVYIHYIGGE